MVSNWRSKSAVAGSSFLLWALVAGSAAYWGLRFAAHPPVLPPPAAVAAPASVDPLSIARLLGSGPASTASPSASSPASRFALQGVVADGGHGGAALIAIDGKPPKPYRVGAEVEPGLVLQSVEARRALLGPAQGAATLTLDLPRPVPGAAASHVPGLPGQVGLAPTVPPQVGVPPVATPQVGGVPFNGGIRPGPGGQAPQAQAPTAAPR